MGGIEPSATSDNVFVHKPAEAESVNVEVDEPAAEIPGSSVNAPLEQSSGTPSTCRTSAASAEAENKLVERHCLTLEAAGHQVARRRITPAGQLVPLFTDVYDITAGELYEAKGTARRDDVRMAIGQLFDYRRRLPEGTEADRPVIEPTVRRRYGTHPQCRLLVCRPSPTTSFIGWPRDASAGVGLVRSRIYPQVGGSRAVRLHEPVIGAPPPAPGSIGEFQRYGEVQRRQVTSACSGFGLLGPAV